MICLLIKDPSGEKEAYWKIGDAPVVHAERVSGVQASEEELDLIYKIYPSKNTKISIQSWFGIDAKKISILVGAAK